MRCLVSVAFISVAFAACARAPLDVGCPELGAGDLVVSELRGRQAGDDSYGAWVELFDASGADVALAGLSVRVRPLDGSASTRVLVRDRALAVRAGTFVVLPLADELVPSGVLDVLACGVLVDRVTWTQLPREGSLALSGATLPDALVNDATSAWCADTRPADPPSATELGVPGTPGQENPPCP